MTFSSQSSIGGPYRIWLAVEGKTGSRERPFRISAAHDEWNHLAIPLVAMERGFFSEERRGFTMWSLSPPGTRKLR